MRSKAGFIVAAGILSSLLIVGSGLFVAWETLLASRPNQPQQQVAGAHGPRFGLKNNPLLFNNEQVPLMADLQMPQAEEPCAPEKLPTSRGNLVLKREGKVSGPHTHGNLAIFLIHGNNTLQDQPILTLQEALEQNLAVVQDPKFSHQLTIMNNGKSPLFIQGGDIVKGGIQDRVLPYDLLIPAQSTASILALCVEQGRSFPRGNEMSTSFQTSTEQLPTNTLKRAAFRQNQQDVWNNVAHLQANLTRNVGANVRPALSLTSLQLTLENQPVQDAIQQHMAKLAPVSTGKNDVIGYAVAINGKVYSADVYASSAMFQKLWPKLIRASAVGAVAEKQAGAFDAPSVETVETFLASAEQGQAFRRQSAGGIVLIRQESGQSLLYDACDSNKENVVLHRSVLTRN